MLIIVTENAKSISTEKALDNVLNNIAVNNRVVILIIII